MKPLLTVTLMCLFVIFSKAQAEDLLWPQSTSKELTENLAKILNHKVDVQSASSEERLHKWLSTPSLQNDLTPRLNQLQQELAQHHPSSSALLAVKVLHAYSLSLGGQKVKAHTLYDEVFRTPLVPERVKSSISNLFTTYPLQVYAKYIAASQLCRESVQAKGEKHHLGCIFAGIYQTSSAEILQNLQRCATHQTTEHCEPTLQQVLEMVFLGDETIPKPLRQHLCTGSSHTRTADEKIICSLAETTRSISAGMLKLNNLSHLTPSALREYSDVLFSPRWKESLPPSKAIGVISEYEYWRLIGLLAYERYDEALKSSLDHCLADTYQALSQGFTKIWHKTCALLARPELWSRITPDVQYTLSERACRTQSVQKLCVRGFAQRNLREKIINLALDKQLNKISRREINPIKIVSSYSTAKQVLHISEMTIKSKTKWGFKWDISGDPEFQLSVRNAKGYLVYRTRLIQSKGQSGDHFNLEINPKRSEFGLINSANLSVLTFTVEEVDPLSSDLVLKREVKFDGQSTLVVQSDLCRFNIGLISGEEVYRQAIETLNTLPPELFYQDEISL